MLKNISNIIACFILVIIADHPACAAFPASADPVNEFYGEIAPGISSESKGTFIATTRFPLRARSPGLQLGPMVSAGLMTASGVFGSAGIHIATPWIPRLPDMYAAARIECGTVPRGGSCLRMSASAESRHGRFLRLNADGDADNASSSAQVRTMFDAFRRPGFSLGAGAGGRFYRDEFASAAVPQAITELRWWPVPSLLVDVMAKSSPGDPYPRLVFSFGGTL